MCDDLVIELYKLVKKFCFNWNLYDEDLIQELVLAVYENLERYDKTKSSLSTFTFMVCKSHYLSSKYGQVEIEFLDEDVVDKQEGNYIKYIYQEVCSPMLRDYLMGFKQKDIAIKYNIPYSTCNQRIQRELQMIKEAYGE